MPLVIFLVVYSIVKGAIMIVWYTLIIAWSVIAKIWKYTIGKLLRIILRAIGREIDRNMRQHKNAVMRITPDKPFTWFWNRDVAYYHMYDNYHYVPTPEDYGAES